MDKNKFTKKLKEGVSVQELEEFARKHTTEVFTVLALVIATISSIFNFFTGPGWTIFFASLGSIIAIFFPLPVERGLKQYYSFSFKQEKTTEMILGGVKIVIAIFVPFILFFFLGCLAGTAFHYYIRHAQIMKDNKPTSTRHVETGEEHD